MAIENEEFSKIRFGWTGYARYFSNFGRKFEKALYTIAEYIGVFLITIGTTKFRWIIENGKLIEITLIDTIPYFLFIVGLCLVSYGRILKSKDFKNIFIEKERYDEVAKTTRILSEEIVNAKQNYSDLHSKFLRNWLKASLYALKLDTPSHRVTIYAYTQDKFLYLSRYSKHTEYNKLHSISFPLNEGVISKAWSVGKHIDIDDCPIFHNDSTCYINYIIQKYGYSSEKIQSLTMKSCQYVAFSIIDEEGPIAVIVFENDCLTHDRFSSQKVSQMISYCEDHKPQLISYIREGIKCNTLGLRCGFTESEKVSKIEKKLAKDKPEEG